MATYTGSKTYETEVYIIEIDDTIKGGVDGADSKPNVDLHNRLSYFKKYTSTIIQGIGKPSGNYGVSGDADTSLSPTGGSVLYLDKSSGNFWRPSDSSFSAWENITANVILNVKEVQINDGNKYAVMRSNNVDDRLDLLNHNGRASNFRANKIIFESAEGYLFRKLYSNDSEFIINTNLDTFENASDGRYGVHRLSDITGETTINSYFKWNETENNWEIVDENLQLGTINIGSLYFNGALGQVYPEISVQTQSQFDDIFNVSADGGVNNFFGAIINDTYIKTKSFVYIDNGEYTLKNHINIVSSGIRIETAENAKIILDSSLTNANNPNPDDRHPFMVSINTGKDFPKDVSDGPVSGFSSGLDMFVKYPNGTYDISDAFVPVENLSGDFTIKFGGNQWLNSLGGDPGDIVDLNGISSSSSYSGLEIYTSGSDWVSFATAIHNGIKTISFPRNADGDGKGGYATYYYKEDAWRTAFENEPVNIIIAQNGSVYKTSITQANLVVRWDGVTGLAGGGSNIEDTPNTDTGQLLPINYTADGNEVNMALPSGLEDIPISTNKTPVSSSTYYFHVGQHYWSSTGAVNTSPLWTGSSSGSYGQVKLTTASSWTGISQNGHFGFGYSGGLTDFLLPNTNIVTPPGGGKISYYFLDRAWKHAFEGTSSTIVIAQNGSVYKDSISLENLVVNWNGEVGLAGGYQVEPNDPLLPMNYSTIGTDADLNEPFSGYVGAGSSDILVLMSTDGTSSDGSDMFIGSLYFESTSLAGSSNYTYSSGSGYGSVRIKGKTLTGGINNSFATNSQAGVGVDGGLVYVQLNKDADGDKLGGIIRIAYDESAWRTAFQDIDEWAYIAQNGSVYKGDNVGDKNFLVIRWDGVKGILGGGSLIDDTVNGGDRISPSDYPNGSFPASAYSTGTDANLTSPVTNGAYTTVSTNYVPAGSSILSKGVSLIINSRTQNEWTADHTDVGTQVSWNITSNTFGVTSPTYGKVFFRSDDGGGPPGENWDTFATNNQMPRGLYTFTLPKTGSGTSDGGYFQYYYDEIAWKNAFSGNNSEIHIAQNGSVYKGDNVGNPDFLVVNWEGVVGKAGGSNLTLENNTKVVRGQTIEDVELYLHIDGNNQYYRDIVSLYKTKDCNIKINLDNITLDSYNDILRATQKYQNTENGSNISVTDGYNVVINNYAYNNIKNTNILGQVSQGGGTVTNTTNINIIGHLNGVSTIGNGDF